MSLIDVSRLSPNSGELWLKKFNELRTVVMREKNETLAVSDPEQLVRKVLTGRQFPLVTLGEMNREPVFFEQDIHGRELPNPIDAIHIIWDFEPEAAYETLIFLANFPVPLDSQIDVGLGNDGFRIAVRVVNPELIPDLIEKVQSAVCEIVDVYNRAAAEANEAIKAGLLSNIISRADKYRQFQEGLAKVTTPPIKAPESRTASLLGAVLCKIVVKSEKGLPTFKDVLQSIPIVSHPRAVHCRLVTMWIGIPEGNHILGLRVFQPGHAASLRGGDRLWSSVSETHLSFTSSTCQYKVQSLGFTAREKGTLAVEILLDGNSFGLLELPVMADAADAGTEQDPYQTDEIDESPASNQSQLVSAGVEPRVEAMVEGPIHSPAELFDGFRWLHLTDLHWGRKDSKRDWPEVRDALFRDLETVLKDKIQHPLDAIFFTGDLVNSGSAEQYAELDEKLAELRKHLEDLGSTPFLVSIPGNHDVLRISKESEEFDDAELIASWPETVESQFWRPSGNPRYDRVLGACFAPFIAWRDKSCHGFGSLELSEGRLPGDFSTTYICKGKRIGVLGLNSTYVQITPGDFQGRIHLDKRQLHSATGGDGIAWCKQHDLCFLLTHQPSSWFNAKSTEEYASAIFRSDCMDIHLCGHKHVAESESRGQGGRYPQNTHLGSSLFGLPEFSGPSPVEMRKRIYGYTVGQVDQEMQLRFWPRVNKSVGHLNIAADNEGFDLSPDDGTKARYPVGKSYRNPVTR